MVRKEVGRSRREVVRLIATLSGVVPSLWLVRTYASGGLMIDPVKEITIRSGRLAITFLLLSLACTPLMILTGSGRLLQARGPLGLWALAFAGVHALAFVGWDYRFDPALLRAGVAYQPFVWVGMVAFLLLAGLGVTSIPELRKRMGRWWRRVQRMTYLAGGLAVWHVLWVKKSPWEAWGYPVVLVGLLLIRVPPVRRAIRRWRRQIGDWGGERAG